MHKAGSLSEQNLEGRSADLLTFPLINGCTAPRGGTFEEHSELVSARKDDRPERCVL